MSAKTHFLKKLQAQQSAPRPLAGKNQADIAAFCQGSEQLQARMDEWLKGTGFTIERITVSLTDLLVGNKSFDVPGVEIRYEDRVITFTPLYLYGQGVKGCMEVSLWATGKLATLYRLFMRPGVTTGWTCIPMEALSQGEQLFDEEVFFGMMTSLLP